jgi:hypothetical protein
VTRPSFRSTNGKTSSDCCYWLGSPVQEELRTAIARLAADLRIEKGEAPEGFRKAVAAGGVERQ